MSQVSDLPGLEEHVGHNQDRHTSEHGKDDGFNLLLDFHVLLSQLLLLFSRQLLIALQLPHPVNILSAYQLEI